MQEANAAGLKVAAHCWTHQGARNAAEAGVASIEHGFAMTNDDLELAKKITVVLVGTELSTLAEQEEGAPGWHDIFRRPPEARLRPRNNHGLRHRRVFFAYPGETRGTLTPWAIDSWEKQASRPKTR